MASDISKPSDIPTLTYLYHTKKLAEPDKPSAYKPDAKLNARVSIWRGNIVKLEADMIVNAANKALLGGGGVDGAIHKAAGPDLFDECETLGGAEVGETKVTKGHKLPAKRIAHTVGPIYSMYSRQKSAQKLQSCYRGSLQLCQKYGGGSIGFSSISTGIYGYPIVEATRIALETTRQFLETDDSITRVIYVVFSEKDEKVYRSLASEFFPDAVDQPDEPASNADKLGEESKPDQQPSSDVAVEQDEADEEEVPFPPSSQATVVEWDDYTDKTDKAGQGDKGVVDEISENEQLGASTSSTQTASTKQLNTSTSSAGTTSTKAPADETETGIADQGTEEAGSGDVKAVAEKAKASQGGKVAAVETEGGQAGAGNEATGGATTETQATQPGAIPTPPGDDAEQAEADDDDEWVDVKKPSSKE